MNWRHLACAAILALPILCAAKNFDKASPVLMANTDFASFGVGGLRGQTSGKITVAGITGDVWKAYLYWHAVNDTDDPNAARTITFDGTTIIGTNIGFSGSNCWPYANSQAYRADVTSIVDPKRNGDYALTDLRADDGVSFNGASLIIFFQDGDPSNNRDVYLFHGNDSNIPNPYDTDNWDINLKDLPYKGGTANITFHVADGQNDDDGFFGFLDPEIDINGALFLAAGPIFEGESVPSDNNGPINNGNLWDIETYDLAPFLVLGNNNLHFTSQPIDFGDYSDCWSAVAITVDFPTVSPCCTLVPNLICQKESRAIDPFTKQTTTIFRPEVINVDGITVGDVLECNGVDTEDPDLIVQAVRLTKITPTIKCSIFETGIGAGLNTNFDSKLHKATIDDLDTSLCQIALERPDGEQCLGDRCLLFSPPGTTYTLQVVYVFQLEGGGISQPFFAERCFIVQVPSRDDIRCTIEYFMTVAAGVTQKCKITEDCAEALNAALDIENDLDALLEFETIVANCAIDFSKLLEKNKRDEYDVRFKTGYIVGSVEEPIDCLLIEMANALLFHD